MLDEVASDCISGEVLNCDWLQTELTMLQKKKRKKTVLVILAYSGLHLE